MMHPQRPIFIGVAWPYANGSLHLGHASAFIGGDVLARYYRMRGNPVLLVSGSDCYGTPIAVEASQQGVEPSVIAEKYHAEFVHTLGEQLGMSYDIYTKTASVAHASVVQDFFSDLLEKGYLYKKSQDALYSPLLGRYLPDRFVEGICPHCSAKDARGDQCDTCGTLLDPLDLIQPRINKKILSNAQSVSESDMRLEKRASEHYYFKLSAMKDQLKAWVDSTSDGWRNNARTFAQSFLDGELLDRAITRDTDWGVPVPVEGFESKRIYVWFEAVLGYLSASKTWAANRQTSDDWEQFWLSENAVHYYVHGKDNIPFHTIIWPAMLLAKSGLHLPDHIVSTENLSLEGKQFSKSRKWAVWLPDALAAFDPDMIRFFLVMYGPETADTDFVWSDFSEKINGELIGTFANLVNRTLTLAEKSFPNGFELADKRDPEGEELLSAVRDAYKIVGGHIEKAEFRAAFRALLDVARSANQYIHTHALWDLIKRGETDRALECLSVLSIVIYNLGLLSSPFLPHTGKSILGFFGANANSNSWEYTVPANIIIKDVQHLFKKITDEQTAAQLAKLELS